MKPFFPIIIILLFSNCTTEKPKAPVFIGNINADENSIKKVISFQTISFDGSENTYNNKTYTALEVEINDPPMSNNLLSSHDEDSVLRNLGKRIVIEIQNNLLDSAEYQYYSIDFIRHDRIQGTKLTRYYM